MAATITGEVVGARTRRNGDNIRTTVYLEDGRLLDLQIDESVRLMLIGQLEQAAS